MSGTAAVAVVSSNRTFMELKHKAESAQYYSDNAF